MRALAERKVISQARIGLPSESDDITKSGVTLEARLIVRGAVLHEP